MSMFVSRQGELELLCAEDGEHRLIEIHGIAGIGKTRLLHEAAKHLRATHPDALVIDLDLKHLAEGHTAREETLVRSLISQCPPSLRTDWRRADRTLEVPVSELNALAAVTPGFLFLDSTEEIQRDGNFLQWLEANLIGPLVVAGQVRQVVAGRQPLAFRRFEVRRHLTRFELGPLTSKSDIQILLTNLWLEESKTRPVDPDQQLAMEVVYDFSYGHPLLCRNIIAHLAEHGLSGRQTRLEQRIGRVVSDFIENSLFKGIGEPWRRILWWSSVFDYFDVPILSSYLDRVEPQLSNEASSSQLVSGLGQVVASGIVQWSPRGYQLAGISAQIIRHCFEVTRPQEFRQATLAASEALTEIQKMLGPEAGDVDRYRQDTLRLREQAEMIGRRLAHGRRHRSDATASTQQTAQLTIRSSIIGRSDEIANLMHLLHARGDRHFVLYAGPADLGKTRLLQELQRMTFEAGPGYRASSIIDLDSWRSGSVSEIERTIIEELDPEARFFPIYRQERAIYERLLVLGADSNALEKRRQRLSVAFVSDFNEMAIESRKLVLCFDTVEALQHDSSLTEQNTNLNIADLRPKGWLLSCLGQLRNVLVVLAGRPTPTNPLMANSEPLLVQEMKAAFGDDLIIVRLAPFTLEESERFIRATIGNADILPATYYPTLHRLADGRPILLGVALDLLYSLGSNPSRVLNLLGNYAHLAEVSEDAPLLYDGRSRFKMELLRMLLYETGELGGYVATLALIPAGVDVDMVREVFGFSMDEAAALFGKLNSLSFVEQYPSAAGNAEQQLSPDTPWFTLRRKPRLFLDKEICALFNSPNLLLDRRVRERATAHTLLKNYYVPRITELKSLLSASGVPEGRVWVQRRLQELQVEYLYYALIRDSREGYEEYSRLSVAASHERRVDFGMQLLGGFMRFYNDSERRQQLEAVGISREQVLREDAGMWVERLYWWGMYDRTVSLGDQILNDPTAFGIYSEEVAIRCSISARLTLARTMLSGYDPDLVQKGSALLTQLRLPPDAGPEDILGRARLAAAIGYVLRLGGRLSRSATLYMEALAVFRRQGRYLDETSSILLNLAYVSARLGRNSAARSMIHDALLISEDSGDTLNSARILLAMSQIEGMEGRYLEAISHGQEALDLFEGMEDAPGTALALADIAELRHMMVKSSLRAGRQLEEQRAQLEEATWSLNRALRIAEEAPLDGLLANLYILRGRIERESGYILARLGNREDVSLAAYLRSQNALERVLSFSQASKVDRLKAYLELVELKLTAGELPAAQMLLAELTKELPSQLLAEPGNIPRKNAEIPADYSLLLARAYEMRARLALWKEQTDPLALLAQAYACLDRFSVTATEKTKLIESMYSDLVSLPTQRLQRMIQAARNWALEADALDSTLELLHALNDRLGIWSQESTQ